MSNKKLHESGINIIQNPDGSFFFEWNRDDLRWSWLNNLTEEQIKYMIEEILENPNLLEEIFNEI